MIYRARWGMGSLRSSGLPSGGQKTMDRRCELFYATNLTQERNVCALSVCGVASSIAARSGQSRDRHKPDVSGGVAIEPGRASVGSPVRSRTSRGRG